MDIPAFISERFVITIETNDDRRKVFQILFQKKDGSLFVAFPYYKETTGLLTLATLQAKTPYPTQLPLKIGGKVTGHKVKYSHHPDGSVHFSQDGKIITKVKKQAVPLLDSEGHVFTVQLQGLKDFAKLKKSENKPTLSHKKTILNFKIEGKPPESYKFVGHWYKKSSLMERIMGVGNKPWFVAEKPDKTKVIGMMISDPFLKTNEPCYLLLTCEVTPTFDSDRYSQLSFIGGFDHKNISLNHEVDTKFLTLAYPASEDYHDLVDEIGTVDYAHPKNI